MILRIYNSYIVDSPEPANISYFWNFGSLLGVCLVLQILTGCFLAMHYVANIDLAFNSVEHIMRDVENGYIIRYVHANVASFFFIFVYSHIGRNLYYGSFKSPRVLVWSIGVIILILMIAIAFLGCRTYSPKWYKYNNYCLNLTSQRNQNKNKNIIYYSTSASGSKSNLSADDGSVLDKFLIEKNLNPNFIYDKLNNKEI